MVLKATPDIWEPLQVRLEDTLSSGLFTQKRWYLLLKYISQEIESPVAAQSQIFLDNFQKKFRKRKWESH